MQLSVGMLAESTDGPCGEVADIVIDPARHRVTHLVVQPHDRHDRARLVPIEQVVSNDTDHVRLAWSTAQLEASAVVEDTDLLPLEGMAGDRRRMGRRRPPGARVALLPDRWRRRERGAGAGYPYGYGWGNGWGGPTLVTTTYDRIPEGTIEVRRASEVRSSDGHLVGHVDGFVVDTDARITHFVLEHGHLWGHREVTIPLVDIQRAESDTVQLRVPRNIIDDYPSVPFHRPGQAT